MPPCGTTWFSWTFIPLSAQPSRLPHISQKTRGNLQRFPRSRLSAGSFPVGVTFYRDIVVMSEFISSYPRGDLAPKPQSRQHVRCSPGCKASTCPRTPDPRIAPGGGTESPRVKRAACGILGGGDGGSSLQPTPRELKTHSRVLSGLEA